MILNGLAESNHKLQHTFSKYQCAIIPEVEVALKTTFRASSQQGYSCIVLNHYKIAEGFGYGTLYAILIYCSENLWNFSSFR